jgi:hypothetical protein
MTFSRSVLLVVLFGALTGCAHTTLPAVGTTTLTSAPWVPDQPFPAALLEEAEEEKKAAAAPAPETWGVRPPTQQELEEFGF